MEIDKSLWYNNSNMRVSLKAICGKGVMNKKEFWYPSADGVTRIHAIKWEPEGSPVGIIQIAHGMVEYIDRYDRFAFFLTENGYIVTGNDHLGHGESVTDKEKWGYFADNDGTRFMLEDMLYLTKLMKEEYGKLPCYLFGHSMGSFLTRRYLCHYGDELQGAVICGTGQLTIPVLIFGKCLVSVIAAFRGWKYRSSFANQLAFGGMNKAFMPARTKCDWLSRDEKEVDTYLGEERCSFIFTVNGYYNTFCNMLTIQKKSMLNKMPKELPVLFIAGGDDPVGASGKGVQKVVRSFQEIGMKDVKCIIYPEYRHEILNEIGKEQVYEDVLDWLN